MHRVVALCLQGVVAFDLAVPAQVFTLAHRPGHGHLYGFSACSVGEGEVATTSGFTIGVTEGLEALEGADTVVVPGYAAIFDPPPDAAIDALRATHARGARVLSVCTGAFALAHAGLLDGRRATTHWAAAGELAARFPEVEVDAASLYVDEGDVLTSAGLSSGIDLCLHVVRADHGAAVGARAARAMVSAPHREGGQAQFMRRPTPASAGTLEQTRRWVLERLREPLDVATMARHASVSPRTFARRFRAETGETPLQWLLAQRVTEARRLLEETELSVEEVARQAGFGTAASMREHFRRVTETTPLAYRRTFSPTTPTARLQFPLT